MESKRAKIYIICQYNREDSGRKLFAPAAAVTWTNYLVRSLKSINDDVTIVSYSAGIGKSYFSKRYQEVDEKESILYLPALNYQRGSMGLRLSQLFSILQIILFLILRTKKNDKVMIYHDYGLSLILKKIRLLLKRKYVIIVGEIFSAVYDRGDKRIKSEIDSIENANGYVLINTLMSRYIKSANNFCVCHGDYTYHKCMKQENMDGKKQIDVVYAGKISQSDITDAFISAEAARHVSGNFYFHILGYGEERDIQALKVLIKEINKERGRDLISYDGCLSGVEYDIFLSKCDIGLCTRVLKEPNCNLCFPSKTLVYLTHGLKVLCPNLEVIKESKIGSLVEMMNEEMTARNIAKKLDRGNYKVIDLEEKIEEIDLEFRKSLSSVIESL